ncbi:ketimine reductase mu-crystallin-like isoform X2 [Anneissia japonica]|nr:ketimine reductase mu-crystallin-like isoform X2 [Anneissia japonica]
MPCVYHGIMTTKVLTIFHDGEKQSRQSLIWLYTLPSAGLKAMIAGETITFHRTAAMSVIATKYLAPKQPKVLAILGAGHQARSHFNGLNAFHQFKETRIWTRSFTKAQTLANELNCIACETAQEAVKDADVIVTVTRSTKPVLMLDWVKKGAHINCVGALKPSYQEIDPELMRNSVVYTDTIEGALKESGDIILSKCDVYAEIGEVVNGYKDAKSDQTTVFKSLGIGVMDTATATFVYENYKSKIICKN